jgi:ABC-type amino acid transport system permease subunit
VNPGENLGIWLAVLAVSTGLTAWNISRLRIVRPALDRLVALIGSAAIVMVVIGASLVVTEVTECTFAASSASSLACSKTEILLVALMDLLASAALITRWLRADACRASAAVQHRGRPSVRSAR